MLIVRRAPTPREDRCDLTLISCDASTLAHHRARAEPPKIKFETCLRLTGVRLARLVDEAFWAVLWYAATCDEHGTRISPLKVCLVRLPLLAFRASPCLSTLTLNLTPRLF